MLGRYPEARSGGSELVDENLSRRRAFENNEVKDLKTLEFINGARHKMNCAISI